MFYFTQPFAPWKCAIYFSKDLEKVGVYGFVTDGVTGDSVLANNPDLSTDAGQFAMIESVTTNDRKVEFELIAAIPREKIDVFTSGTALRSCKPYGCTHLVLVTKNCPSEMDVTQFENGIGPLNFDGLRIISYPGGQQYGAISPCEMNEFSSE
eukprot:6802622-Ditylum_brightwellii.AAC.1